MAIDSKSASLERSASTRLIVHPRQRGKANLKAIGEIERFLIKLGKDVNPALKNTHHAGEPRWEIDAVASGRGRRAAPVAAFRKMMKLG